MSDLFYSPNLFYSKLDLESNINYTKKTFFNKLLLMHLFYMSFYLENSYNIDFKKMDIFLKNNNALTYIINDISNSNIKKYFIKKETNITEFSGGVNTSAKIKTIFLNSTKKIKNKFKIYDNHFNLSGNKIPIIPINELSFCVILNYLGSSPPIFLQNINIRNILENVFEIYIKNKNKNKKRKNYLELNLKFKKKFENEFSKLKKKKFTIEEQILLNSKKIIKSKYLKNISFIYDTKTKIKPYLFIFENILFITIKGTQTIEQVKQDVMSIKMDKISNIIQIFIKKYNPNKEYIQLLTSITNSYGIYKYGSGFFEPVLYILHIILQQMDLLKNNFKDIYIVGHSLGGAQSTILGILFLHIRNIKKYKNIFENKIIKVITFGEPSGISKEFVKKIQKDMDKMFQYTRVV
jgi:hypothetical protein